MEVSHKSQALTASQARSSNLRGRVVGRHDPRVTAEDRYSTGVRVALMVFTSVLPFWQPLAPNRGAVRPFLNTSTHPGHQCPTGLWCVRCYEVSL